MTLKTQMETDVGTVFFNNDEFSEDVSYAVYGGSTSTIKAIITPEIDLAESDPGQVAQGRALIKVSDLANPTRHDTLTTAAAIVWRVDDVLGGDGYVWTLQVSTDHRPGVKA